MEEYEEKMFDQIREGLLKCNETTSEISKKSGVSYYTVVNILKGNKNRLYNAETYGKLKAFLKIV